MWHVASAQVKLELATYRYLVCVTLPQIVAAPQTIIPITSTTTK